MDIVLIILAILILLINVALFFVFLSGRKTKEASDSTGINLLMQQLNNLGKTVDEKLGVSAREMQESLKYQAGESYKVIRDITSQLTKLDEANKQVIGFTDQLTSRHFKESKTARSAR